MFDVLKTDNIFPLDRFVRFCNRLLLYLDEALSCVNDEVSFVEFALLENVFVVWPSLLFQVASY